MTRARVSEAKPGTEKVKPFDWVLGAYAMFELIDIERKNGLDDPRYADLFRQVSADKLKLLLIRLATYANGIGDAWPSVRILAQVLN